MNTNRKCRIHREFEKRPSFLFQMSSEGNQNLHLFCGRESTYLLHLFIFFLHLYISLLSLLHLLYFTYIFLFLPSSSSFLLHISDVCCAQVRDGMSKTWSELNWTPSCEAKFETGHLQGKGKEKGEMKERDEGKMTKMLKE